MHAPETPEVTHAPEFFESDSFLKHKPATGVSYETPACLSSRTSKSNQIQSEKANCAHAISLINSNSFTTERRSVFDVCKSPDVRGVFRV